MMASHRPNDPPPPPLESTSTEPAPTTAPAGLTTLPHSSFLVGFDWVLAFGVLALAFLIASFAVKNPDFWMHLATGRLLADGQYEFGKDPFSYTGEGRTWVNHAWLFDWLLYLLFKTGAGAAVVIAKAVAIAVAAGLVLVTRKPGQSVFPGVVCAGLAVVAAAPRLFLQPTVASILFLAVLMFLLIRVPRRPGSWLFPGLIAGLFLLWVNCDQWFLIGPAALLLYTIGQYVRADEGEHIPTLWKALLIGAAVTLLNPHHVRAWMPPAELIDGRLAADLAKDPELAGLFRGALSAGSLDFSGDRDNPANLYALLALVALSVVGFAVNRRHASVGLALVWAGAVILALVHLRAIPFLAFVAAPVAAVNLAAAGRRLADTPLPDGTARTLHALRGGGRAAVGMVGVILIILTYPGWLAPYDQQRRWKWDVEPNPSLERAAKKIHEWRTAGTLPPEARLLNLHPDFASYVAWYAPGEKTFFDYRIGFHRNEAGTYAALRRYLSYPDARRRRQDPFDLADFLSRHQITYAVYAPARTSQRNMLAALWRGDDPGSLPEWSLWDVQGRAVTFGWNRQRTIPTAAFERLRFDPLRLAYVDAQPLPRPTEKELQQPPSTKTDVWERFLVPPPQSPVDAEEALVLLLYRQTLLERATARHQWNMYAIQAIAHTRLMNPALGHLAAVQPVKFPAEAEATATLAVRAARRAVLNSPDHPDGYYFLSTAYSDMGFIAAGDVKDAVSVASLARARARIPDDPTQQRPSFEVPELCRQLFFAYERSSVPPRLDLAVDVLKLMIVYLKQDIQDREAYLTTLPPDSRDAGEADVEERRRYLNDFERALKDREPRLETNRARYVIEAADRPTALERAAVARRWGLVREAIAELRKEHEQVQKRAEESGGKLSLPPNELARVLAVYAELIEQLWYDGKVEEAVLILNTVDTPVGMAEMDHRLVRDEYYRLRQQFLGQMFRGQKLVPQSPYDGDPAGHFRNLRRALSIIVGDFDRAAEVQIQESQLVRQNLDEFLPKAFPNGLPDLTKLPSIAELQKDLFTKPVLTAVTYARMRQLEKVAQLRNLTLNRAEGQLALGLTYLEQGDVPKAVTQLKLAAGDAPGWPEPIRAQRVARDLLRTIERTGPARGTGP